MAYHFRMLAAQAIDRESGFAEYTARAELGEGGWAESGFSMWILWPSFRCCCWMGCYALPGDHLCLSVVVAARALLKVDERMA
jgi:hypothetical protein